MNKGIRRIFSEVPETYELINHILTFGHDILWRRRAARWAAEGGGRYWMDMATGTGETAALLRRHAPRDCRVLAVDFSVPMLRKARTKPEARAIRLAVADASALPFPDDTLDLVTVTFATRNLNVTQANLRASFGEFLRVLRPGGRFVNLETSQPASSLLRTLYHLYVKISVRPVGSIISGSKAGYTYLSRTIPSFYGYGRLREILLEIGFSQVDVQPLLSGVAAIHRAVK